jgi:rod shape-determining protein MreD
MADLLELTPLGAQGLAFLTVSLWIRSRQRRFTEQNFIQLWASFALIVFLEMLFLWLAEALATGTILPPGRLAMGGLASVVVFPLIVRVLLVPAERLAREARHV